MLPAIPSARTLGYRVLLVSFSGLQELIKMYRPFPDSQLQFFIVHDSRAHSAPDPQIECKK